MISKLYLHGVVWMREVGFSIYTLRVPMKEKESFKAGHKTFYRTRLIFCLVIFLFDGDAIS